MASSASIVISTDEERRQLRRAVVASTVGTAIEWYDFFLYSSVTALVFGKLFFPKSDPVVGTLQAFAIYAVGFIARPIGAAIFGHYGDRMGRKSALIATLLLMGIATFLVALVPGYAVVGIWGAVILTVLRFVQGIGVGGEWGGSVLLAMEWAKQNSKRRGLIASWPQFGVPAGLCLANVAVLSFSAISGGCVPQLGLAHPVSAQHPARRRRPLHPPRHHRDAGIPTHRCAESGRAGAGARGAAHELEAGRAVRVRADVRAGALLPVHRVHRRVRDEDAGCIEQPRARRNPRRRDSESFTIPYFGYLSDRIGRRRMYMIGAVTVGSSGSSTSRCSTRARPP